ncbi:alpha-D-ribose 1-methylphosphonate 5-triphosphate diphosphatase [Teichococcus oryzae]|uniref:Alpha-D-ribose 1-methylphosphonate 5-triphosphate diphosphatase n=1 Tax=Teichococcus oryzae TaxID=1608942 RepID=A0A5B2TBM6_9PROT|nr:alpha-D-ribose 1-methylphosphonate 5-triphosphate diphosphatase [Pseudoroseomonas oryzae]KAA2211465.1 alpha-D-ribose 1-methylphosphonate 5-triphosphate diphosphatase [Pseudoroseomonas oryzae]
MSAWHIGGGMVLREGVLRRDDVFLREGLIALEADRPRRFDATGLLVLPGIVDLHGDAQERQFQPRPGVTMPATLALRDSRAQLLAAGITTAFLGITLSWEPGLRSIDAWHAALGALGEIRAERGADLRVHLRFEADNLEAVDEAVRRIAAGEVHLLAFNDHTPAILRKLETEAGSAKYAERAGVAPEVVRHLARQAASRRDEIPAARARLVAAALSAGIPMVSHDESTVEERRAFRALGVGICEFPMAEAVAAEARAAGEVVVMGAPNVVRGGSHLGWASAADLAERGLVSVLASDYVWPALLEAAFVLEGRGRLDLPAAWALVSANPALAAGLADRGAIRSGLRGDLVLVDRIGRAPVATFCAGRLCWVSPEAAARLRP